MRPGKLQSTIDRLRIFNDYNSSRVDFVDQILVSIFLGAYALFIIIALQLPVSNESTETQIFVEGWGIAPLFAFLGLAVLRWDQRKHLHDDPITFFFLSSLNTIAISISLILLYIVSRTTGHPRALQALAFFFAVMMLLINLAAVWSLHFPSAKLRAEIVRFTSSCQKGGSLFFGMLGLLPFIGLYPYFLKDMYVTPLVDLLAAAMIGGLAGMFHHFFQVRPIKNWLLYAFDAAALALICLACFDPRFTIDPHHQNFYIGPMNRVLHGGTMLVDTFCQYGVLSVLFLAGIFKTNLLPYTIQSLSFITSLLCMAQFFTIYLLMTRGLSLNRFYAALLLAVTLMLGLYGTMGVFQAYPSIGPLRFGIVYLLLASIYMKEKYSRFENVFTITAYLIVGVSSLWSFEAFVYTGFAFFGIQLFESFAGPTVPIRALRNLAISVLWTLVAVVLSQLAYALFTYFTAGELPDWKTYMELVMAYTGDNALGSILITPWSPWIFPLAIYFSSLMIFVYKVIFAGGLKKSLKGKIIIGLTFFGIAQYTYFLGRSHPNNLYHIVIPVILIAGYWLVQLMHHPSVPRHYQVPAYFVFYAAVSLAILTSMPAFVSKFTANQTGFRLVMQTGYRILQGRNPLPLWKSVKANLFSPVFRPQELDAIQYIKKYISHSSTAGVFLSNTTTTPALFITRKIHIFPMSDPIEDMISPTIFNRNLAYQPQITVNEKIIVIDPEIYNKDSYNLLIVELIKKLCSSYSLHEIERSPNGVSVMKLLPKTSENSSYCSKIEALVVK